MSSGADRWDAIIAEKPPAAAPSGADRWDAIMAEAPKPSKEQAKSALGGDWDNFWAGAGKAVVDLGRGAKQIIDKPAQWLEVAFPGISRWSQEKLGMPSAASSAAATQQDINASRERDAPLTDTKAGIAGNVAGNVAGMMVPLGVASAAGSTAARTLLNPSTYKAAATSGALQGAFQPVAEGESREANMVGGAAAGMAGNAIVNAVGRIAQPVKAIASAAHDKAVEVLDKAGISLDAAQRTGSTFLNKLRSSFADNPVTAGAQADLMAQQRGQFNRAVLRTIGEDANAATPEVMGGAEKRIDGVFKDVLDRNSVAVNDSMLARMGDIQKRAIEEEKKPVAAIANRFMDAVRDDGTVPGQIAYNVKKDLDRLASSADTTLAYHARQLRSTVMDGIHSSLNEADRAAFDQARGQFANMKKIEGVIDDAGDISAPKLANVFRQKRNRAVSIYGKGPQDLYDLAQAGSMLLPDRNPNSGTAGRIAMQILPAVVGGGAGAAEGYLAGDESERAGRALEHAAMGAVTLGAIPKIAQAVVNNQAAARYAQSGMRGGATPIRDLLLLPQTNETVGGIARRVGELETARITKRESARP